MSILKREVRHEAKVAIKGGCFLNVAGSDKLYHARLTELSVSGVSLYMSEPALADKALVQVKLRSSEKDNVTFAGIVIGTPTETETEAKIMFRYTIQFDHRLSEALFKQIIAAYELIGATGSIRKE